MSEIYAIVDILIIAAITPGPNNIIVMSAAINGGWRAATLVFSDNCVVRSSVHNSQLS